MNNKGFFITFEGGEGSGKTTLIEGLKAKLEQNGYKVKCTREPGGVVIAEKIRDIILDNANLGMESETEALLYAASRVEHLKKVVIPHLEDNYVVLCDRYLDSSLVYQGMTRGLGAKFILDINNFASRHMPELTFFLDVKPEVGLARIQNRQEELNRLDNEAIAFHESVYNNYKKLLDCYPDRIKSVDGTLSVEKIISEVYNEIVEKMKG